MKRALLFLGGLLILLVAVALALPLLIDPNQFRPLLESRLTQALGRDVKLGNLKLSVFQGSVAADDLSIAEDPAFGKEPFLKAKSLQAQVEMRPLIFSRQFNVTGITVDQPEIVLIQTVAGKWNVSTLGGAATQESSAAPAAAAPGSKLDLVVHSVEITKGKLTLIDKGEGSGKPRQLEQVGLTVKEFSPTVQFPFTFTGHIDTGGDLKLTGKAGPINDTDAELTPAEAHYSVTGFDLAASRLFDASTGIRGLVSAEGDMKWSGTGIEGKGLIRADRLILAKDGAAAQRVVELDFDVSHDVVHHVGQLERGGIHIGKAVANLTGNYSLKGAVPSVILNLSGTKMPVDELVAVLPALDVRFPQGSSLKGGTMTMKFTSAGYLNNVTTKGNFSVDGTSLQNFDLGTKMRVMETLAGIKGGANTEFQTIGTKITQTNQGTTLEDLEVVATGIGELSGGGTISAQKELGLKMRVNLHTSGGVIDVVHKGDTGLAFTVGGTVSNPAIHPDVKGMVKEVAKDAGKQATKAAFGLLNGFLNGKKDKKSEPTQ
jgi:AsmA protein